MHPLEQIKLKFHRNLNENYTSVILFKIYIIGTQFLKVVHVMKSNNLIIQDMNAPHNSVDPQL